METNKDIKQVDESIKLASKLIKRNKAIIFKNIIRLTLALSCLLAAFYLAYVWFDWKMLLIIFLVVSHFKLVNKYLI